MKRQTNIVAIARRIESKAGLIWIPPTGRPYWIEQSNSRRELTDAEIKEHINDRYSRSR